MRKYDSKNKRNIGIIIVICILVTVIFSFFLIKVINKTKIKYELDISSLVFDIDKNAILLNESGTIKKKWNKNYYLTYKDEQYQIGNHVIAFNNNEESLILYGQFYEINKKSEVTITKEETKLNNLVISRFYKLEDRKYLIVDADIKSEDGLLKTNNYLIVELDKLGNAILYNNSLNVKTFKETKIVTSNYTFDIANELLIYEEETIDLKEILGTTNEYKKEEEKENNKEDELSSNPNNDNNQTGNNTNPGINNNLVPSNPNGDIDSGNSSNNDKDNGSDNDNMDNSTESDKGEKPGGDINTDESGSDITDSEVINQSSSTSILRITPTYNSIEINYVIYDKANKYIKMFVEVESEYGSNVFYLNKSTTSLTLTNLYSNTDYKLTFKYLYNENEEEKQAIIDSYNVKTLLPSISVDVNKFGTKNIDYKINSGKVVIESAVLRLYVDGVLQDVTKSVSGSGFINDKLTVNTKKFAPGSLIVLSLEDVVISGKPLNHNYTWSHKIASIEDEKVPEEEKGEE